MALTEDEVGALVKLLAGTLSEYDLEVLVGESTGDELFVHWVGRGKPLEQTIRDLVKALENEGATQQFLAEVYRRRPKRNDVRLRIALLYPEIIGLAAQVAPDFDLQQRGAPGPSVAAGSFAPGLQRNIKDHLHMLNIGQWATALAEAQRRVCRVEIGDAAAGTGFLVGPKAVLTNWHVVEAAVLAGKSATIGCRFDYADAPGGGRNPGTRVALDGDVVWHRPYAPAEVTADPDTPPPLATELDFALLSLASPAGQDPVGGMERGWMALPAAPTAVQPGAGIIIVQHPDGGPMKLAIDTEAVLALPPPADRPRLRYATNTEPGSSGSPCFTMDWELIAVHHLGDPAWKKQPQFNQGVPAHLIRQDIAAAGHAALLG